MRTQWMQIVLLSSLFAGVATGAAPAFAQTSVAASFYGAFSGTTNGNGTQQSPSNAAGGLVELRHISNPLIGYEATYSFNRANQSYMSVGGFTALLQPPTSVSADGHEITGDWVVSAKLANLRPFALAGLGVLLNEPAGQQANTTSSTQAVYVYGAGLDWGLVPHIGLRLQYRGNLYKAPDLTRLYTSTSAFTHTAEPMIGAYFNF
ncbi:MAG: outer membrane beta-barrel protein [Terracidiphilus sp.]